MLLVTLITLVAAPLPADAPTQAQLQALDQPQLLALHDLTERTLPRRWPAGISLGVGIFGFVPTGIVLIVAAATQDTGAIITGVILLAVSTGLTTFGAVFLKWAGKQRDRIYATLHAIEDRLDVLERAEPYVPSPELLAALSAPPPPAHVGGLVVSVTDGRAPLSDAVIELAGRSIRTDAQGLATFDGLDPGPLPLTAKRDGYEPITEYAAIVPGQRAAVSVKLLPQGHQAPAKLTGLVRSADDGTPLAAGLSVAGRTLQADPRGLFAIELEEGTWTVHITAARFLPQTRQVTLKAGERVIFNVDLHRETSP